MFSDITHYYTAVTAAEMPPSGHIFYVYSTRKMWTETKKIYTEMQCKNVSWKYFVLEIELL